MAIHAILVNMTHNLEVVGSSPTWSTLRIKELRSFRDSLIIVGEHKVETLHMISCKFLANFLQVSRIFPNFAMVVHSNGLQI